MLLPLLVASLFSTSSPKPPAAAAPAQRVFVFAFRAEGDVDVTLVRAIERDVATAASRHRLVVSQQDVAAMVDVEAARQAAGCDGGASCLSELAGSFGAEEVLTGTLTSVAGETELHLVLLDSSGARVLARAQHTAPSSSPRALRDGVALATASLFGVASGPHPAAIVGGVVAGIGGVGVVVGLVPLAMALVANSTFEQAAGTYSTSGARSDLEPVFSAAHDRDEATTAWNGWGWVTTAIGSACVVAGVATAVAVPMIGVE